jgi:hypothetical protein
MIKLAILAFVLTQIYCQSTITFDTPGSFVLTPSMYRYADRFIIKMWGAGGAGGCTFGGSAGAYIGAIIYTNQSNFDVVIGRGGYGNAKPTCSDNLCQSVFQYQESNDGGSTTFSNSFINFTANGGAGGGGSRYYATVSTSPDDTLTTTYQQLRRYEQKYYSWLSTNNANGMYAMYGGGGGIYNDTANIDGFFPGGGGSAALVTSTGTCATFTIPTGANGAVVLYLVPKINLETLLRFYNLKYKIRQYSTTKCDQYFNLC